MSTNKIEGRLFRQTSFKEDELKRYAINISRVHITPQVSPELKIVLIGALRLQKWYNILFVVKPSILDALGLDIKEWYGNVNSATEVIIYQPKVMNASDMIDILNETKEILEQVIPKNKLFEGYTASYAIFQIDNYIKHLNGVSEW